MYKLDLEKSEEPEIKLPTSAGLLKKQEFQKNIYYCFIEYTKAFDYTDHNKLWKILQEMGIPDHLTCLLRNLYAGQEATVRTGNGTTDWFQIGKLLLSHFSHVRLCATLWTIAHQTPQSMGFSKQEYWSGSGWPFLPPGDLPNPGIEPTSLTSPALAGRFFTHLVLSDS